MIYFLLTLIFVGSLITLLAVLGHKKQLKGGSCAADKCTCGKK